MQRHKKHENWLKIGVKPLCITRLPVSLYQNYHTSVSIQKSAKRGHSGHCTRSEQECSTTLFDSVFRLVIKHCQRLMLDNLGLDEFVSVIAWSVVIFGINTTIVIRNFTSRQASEIWDNFEISRVVFMPNITYKSCYYSFILLPAKGL